MAFRQLELQLTVHSDHVPIQDRSAVVGQALRLPITITAAEAITQADHTAIVGHALRLPTEVPASGALALQRKSSRDAVFERYARELLRTNGAGRIASQLRVEWNRRLKTCAGRANYRSKLISLNPLLHAHGHDEVRRTLLHELAHLLAQFRAGRRRIAPHGEEWRRACHDLGIGDEKRCHNLPLPVNRRARRFLYRCPHCQRDFPRTRRLRRSVACLACCRAHSRGHFDTRFKLKLVNAC